MSDSRRLPARPSLVQLRKQAKDLLRAGRAGDDAATTRFGAVIPPIQEGAAPKRPTLADAQFIIAREYGFSNWAALARHVASVGGDDALSRPLIRPVELQSGREWRLTDGTSAPTDAIWAMFVAAREGDAARVKSLVAESPALALVEYCYTPPIHFAAREGHAGIVAVLLERGADPAYRSYPFQESLLTLAEERGHVEVAELLRGRLARRFALRPGTDTIIAAAEDGDLARVNAELARDPELARASNETGDTALHRAARRGHAEVVQALLRAGADADAIRGDGYRPIHCSLMAHWHVPGKSPRADAIADALLAHGARYTIFVAALRGDDRFVRDSLRRDRSLANFEDTCHHRVLSAAVRRNDIETTRLLLEHGADPNLPEEGAPRGLSLWIAVDNRSRDIVRLLLEHGADPNAEVESSGTPMSHARRDPELLALLRAHGGVEQSGDRERLERMIGEGDLPGVERLVRQRPELIHDDLAFWGDGILAGPAHGGNHALIELLMRLGARVPNVSKWAPYYYFKHEKTAAFLLDRGMNPNHMNWHRFTLLHHMAATGDIAKARLLLDHGADVDALDDEYRSTPLGVAARFGQHEAVALLLERGADPNLSGAKWSTPLEWARRRGYEGIVGLLRGGGAER